MYTKNRLIYPLTHIYFFQMQQIWMRQDPLQLVEVSENLSPQYQLPHILHVLFVQLALNGMGPNEKNVVRFFREVLV